MLRYAQTLGAVAAALLAWSMVLSSPSLAQEPAAQAPLEKLRDTSQPLNPDAVNALVSRLSDEQVRELLLERLDAVATSDGRPADIDIAGNVQAFEDRASLMRERIAELGGAVADVPAAIPQALDTLRDGRPWSFFFGLLLGFAVMMAVGWLAEWLFDKATRAARQSIITAKPEGLGAKLCILGARLGLDLVGLLVFLGAAIGTFFILHQGHEMTRVTVMTYIAAVGVVRLFSLFARVLLSPNATALRIERMSDDDARFLHRASTSIAAIAAFGFFTCSLLKLLGMSDDVHDLLAYIVTFVMCAALVFTIAKSKEGLRGNLLDDIEDNRARRLFANAWPTIAIGFVILFFVMVVLLTLAHVEVSYLAAFGTLLTVLFLPPIDAVIERAAIAKIREDGSQLQAVILRALRIGLAVGAVLFIAGIWGVNFHEIATNSIGGRFAEALIDIGMVALIAYVLWEVSSIMIDRRIEAEGGGEQAEMGDEGGTGGSRLGTLLPLIKRTIQITIGVMAVMLVLSAFGVNIGPLLAGAGVIGVAIGFGAQTLVRDIVSGIFFLVDDAFRRGEYVDVGVAKGTVEKISIRSFQLRHHRGALNTVPFGEIQTLTNYSRDWVVMKLEFRVPFDTDIALVKKLFKQIGKNLLEHPEIGNDFLAPFKSQGVFSVDDSALIIRAKFTAKPGKQFLIKREAYQAVQKAFAENDIEFARKQVMVQIPDDNGLPPEDRDKLEKAAASAIGAELEPEPGPSAAQR